MRSNEAPTISALSHEGLSVTTADGRPAQFAILDEEGNIVAVGKEIAEAAWQASVNAYRQFLMGRGHLRILTKPDGLVSESD
jgi:hypothetical protein